MFTSNLGLHRLEVSVIENVLFPVMSRFSLSRGASMDVARSNLGDRIKRCGRSPVPFRLYDEMKSSRLVCSQAPHQVMRGCAMAVTSGALARYAEHPQVCVVVFSKTEGNRVHIREPQIVGGPFSAVSTPIAVTNI